MRAFVSFHLFGRDASMSSISILSFVVSFGVAMVLAEAPVRQINNGRSIPAVALGTSLGFNEDGVIKSQNKQLRDVVLRAIELGYRHFDTAAVYETEEEIGEAVNLKIQQGAISRDDVFITTKLWNTHHKREQVGEALKESLKRFGLDYVDLYLMHWPIGLNEDNTSSRVDFMETWRGMEDAHKQGLAKSIGVSNFNKDQLERLFKEGEVKPSVLQIEIHPQMVQKELVEYAQSKGLVVMGFSPFGSLVPRFGMKLPGPQMDDPVLVALANKYGKTTPQIVLRWLVDRNIVPVPKTVNVKRLPENIGIFDFKLTPEEIEKINGFDEHKRYTLPSFWQEHPYYPFEKIDNPMENPFVKPK